MNEREKYEAIWARPEYRQASPGERVAVDFVEWVPVSKDDTVIDFGCGSGRGGKRIHELTGCGVVFVDFASNCLDEDVRNVDWAVFHEADLSQPIGVHGKIGFCTDVMEHLPPEQVDETIRNIMESAKRVFFQISLVHDSFGKLLGPDVHLHLSVFPHPDWIARFHRLGYKVVRSAHREPNGLYLVEHA